MRTIPAAVAAALLPLLLSACDDERCDAACPAVSCPPPFFLAVDDAASGEPVAGASASSASLPCVPGPLPATVQCDAPAGGAFTITVSAPGYVAQQVPVTVDPPVATRACECPVCQEWQPVAVSLVPAG